jgi:hypothetical protein
MWAMTCRPFHELHDQRCRILLEPVNDRDVRVIQRGKRPSFPLEPCEPVWVLRECVGQDLDGDLASEVPIRRAIDLAHAASADLRAYRVWTHANAR